MTSVQVTLAALGVIVVVMVPMVGALWRFASKVRDNTSEVTRLTTVVEGTASALGLNARVRSLEDWRTATEAVAQAEAAAAARAHLTSGAA